MSHSINIVSFDIPFPADYGGVIDVYYKLVWLKKNNVKIYLHCFSYGRKPSKEIEEICEKVYYYERKTGMISNFSFLPYTVKSRQSSELAINLLKNDFPILFEVLHTCHLLNDDRFKNRKKIYRHSNIEHDYYTELSKSERSFLKKIYLKIEAFKLKKFERVLAFSDLILAVNQRDRDYFEVKFPSVKSVYLPSFHPNDEVKIEYGVSDFVLFHGNLSVSENYEAAIWLIKNVFSKLTFRCVIAGLNPPKFLIEMVENYKNIKIIKNPTDTELNSLIVNAQVHTLYTGQPTGLKLKLLNVLFRGRFVLCNSNMIAGTCLKENVSLIVVDDADSYVKELTNLMNNEFTSNQGLMRKEMIDNFINEVNARKLIQEVF